MKEQLIAHIETSLALRVTCHYPVSGGSINQAYCLQTHQKKYFIKLNNNELHPGMFEAEAAGLTLINNTATAAVPKILLQGETGAESFLLLEWINSVRPTANGSARLGQELAGMHRCSAPSFGLAADNYMGSLPQSNRQHQNWSAFFIAERLQPMVRLAADKHLLSAADIAAFDELYKNLPDLFNEEPPSLIHGDLWSGNYLIGTDGTPYLIDPAVSYGHREFDIAMTLLFGGFSQEFYQAYDEAFPLVKDWEQRVDLWNLYPLLLHLNLFDSSYLGQVRECLKQYI